MDSIYTLEPSETLIGVHSGIEPTETSFGKQHILLVRDESGVTYFLFITVWLRRLLKTHDAKQGDWLAITYTGKRECKSGMQCNAYDLICAEDGLAMAAIAP